MTNIISNICHKIILVKHPMFKHSICQGIILDSDLLVVE